jgi:hypothetical protein
VLKGQQSVDEKIITCSCDILVGVPLVNIRPLCEVDVAFELDVNPLI